jgi:mannose-1-phosphate guanylyltransferase
MMGRPVVNLQAWSGGGAAKAGGSESLRKLKVVVLLAGTVRAPAFVRAIGRWVLGLPLEDHKTVLDQWREQAGALAAAVGNLDFEVRVMVDRAMPLPQADEARERGPRVRFEYDPGELRGTGGLLSDVACSYENDALMLVCNAAQVMIEPMDQLALELAALGGELGLVGHEDGTPSGMMLMRCGSLREVAKVGFVDLKEQALPTIAKRHRVKVLRRDKATGLPIRTREDYVEMLLAYHRHKSAAGVDGGAFVEDWEPTFSLVESGAQVAASARVHDSVVLAGGRVEADATLVRSVVGPGGVAPRRSMNVDQVIGATN